MDTPTVFARSVRDDLILSIVGGMIACFLWWLLSVAGNRPGVRREARAWGDAAVAGFVFIAVFSVPVFALLTLSHKLAALPGWVPVAITGFLATALIAIRGSSHQEARNILILAAMLALLLYLLPRV